MTAWPTNLTVKSLISWPGPLTPDRGRKSSPFRAGLSQTCDELDLELHQLGATNQLMQVAVPAHRFGVKGRPFADAVPDHPGVILTMNTNQGALSYPCDTFNQWQDNLRAITLALEALRKVDRYGVTKNGEQYRGFLALEATIMPTIFVSSDEARNFIWDIAADISTTLVDKSLPQILRIAKRATHPDTRTNDADIGDYARVMAAEKLLQEAGLL